ncbi:hypothetical protein [Rhodospirillum centenum]|nr:hypothetical protein [Rhodospirillum centenum]
MTGSMTPERARAQIRFLAEADRLLLLRHARNREPGAGKFPLTREQIRQCLLHGVVREGPSPDIREPEGWKFTMRRLREGERHEVAGVLIPGRNVLVITGYGWDRIGRRPRRGAGGKRGEGQDNDDGG